MKFFAGACGGAIGFTLAALLVTYFYLGRIIGFDGVVLSILLGFLSSLVGIGLYRLLLWMPSESAPRAGSLALLLTMASCCLMALCLAFVGDWDWAALAAIAFYGLMSSFGISLSMRVFEEHAGDMEWGRLSLASSMVLALSLVACLFPVYELKTERIARVNDRNFSEEVLESELPVVVEFSAKWCGPCRLLFRKLDYLAGLHEGRIKFVVVDVDESPEIAERYSLSSGLPYVVVFRNGRITAFTVARDNAQMLDEFLREVLRIPQGD